MQIKLKLITSAALFAAVTGYSALPLVDDFEGETIGNAPSLYATSVSPSVPTTNGYVSVVGGSTNVAGTGQAVSIFDGNAGAGLDFAYRFAPTTADQVSGLRIDFLCAPYVITNESGFLFASLGAGSSSMNSSAQRFFELRFYGDGTIDFLAASSDNNNVLNASDNAVNIFVNDSDTMLLEYTGPDGSTNTLAANSAEFWLNNTLELTSLLYDRATSGGTVFNTTNNLGRFSIKALTSAITGVLVVDDIAFTELTNFVEPPPPEVFGATLVDEDFEADTLGDLPSSPDALSANNSSNFVMVVGGTTNIAGTGQAVRLAAEGDTLTCVWNLGNGGYSALRADLKLAPINTTAVDTNANIRISFGAFGSALPSYGSRFINSRVYSGGGGLIGLGAYADYNNPRPYSEYELTQLVGAIPLLASNNTLTIIANDYDSQSVDYTGLDQLTYTLPANSVAYWLNGSLVTFEGADYTVMDLSDPTSGGTIGTTEGNLGSFGFSCPGFSGQDFVFDDIFVTTNLLLDGYADWLTLYPALGASTNLLDDYEPDGFNNLMEFALGGNPTVDDAASLQTTSTSADGGTNWFNLVYSRRIDSKLSSEVNASTDLLSDTFIHPTEELASPPSGGFQDVTNRVPTDTEAKQFMQLKVQYD